jgi:UDP-GlcNAc3NAcA epimerase
MSARRLRFVSIVGARPQFVKAAVVSKAIRVRHDEFIIHTGQHYDAQMSSIFFDEMGIPRPDLQLDSGSGTHGEQTAAMLVGLEGALAEQRPDWVVTFGDTNSTLAGALAAAKLHLPIVHIEAGLRSFNRRMAEEINRVVVDHISAALFCPSQTAVANLAREGICQGVHLVGDVMAEALNIAAQTARVHSRILEALTVSDGQYLLLTIHRAENTDSRERLFSILSALDAVREPVIFPVHPRTRKVLNGIGWVAPRYVQLVQPLGYIDMVRLLTGARLVLTDSGGLQKEAYWAGVPCVTLRDETEWVETVAAGWNVVAGADTAAIVEALKSFEPPRERPELYGGTGVAARCVNLLEDMSTGRALDT